MNRRQTAVNRCQKPSILIDMGFIEPEAAAHTIQNKVITALFSTEPTLQAGAKDWLFLGRRPSLNDTIRPAPDGFIAACALLGINWRELSSSLTEAAAIPTAAPTAAIPHPRPAAPRELRLVHSAEPCYTKTHETCTHRNGTRQA